LAMDKLLLQAIVLASKQAYAWNHLPGESIFFHLLQAAKSSNMNPHMQQQIQNPRVI